jgi:hypothetical protein
MYRKYWKDEELNSLSGNAIAFFNKAIEKHNYDSLLAIDARYLSREDMKELVKIGFTFTTDRMNIPMGKVSTQRKIDNIRNWVISKGEGKW